MQFVDAATPELFQQRQQIDLAFGIRKADDFCPCSRNASDLAMSCTEATNKQPAAIQYLCLQWQFQTAINDDFQ